MENKLENFRHRRKFLSKRDTHTERWQSVNQYANCIDHFSFATARSRELTWLTKNSEIDTVFRITADKITSARDSPTHVTGFESKVLVQLCLLINCDHLRLEVVRLFGETTEFRAELFDSASGKNEKLLLWAVRCLFEVLLENFKYNKSV